MAFGTAQNAFLRTRPGTEVRVSFFPAEAALQIPRSRHRGMTTVIQFREAHPNGGNGFRYLADIFHRVASDLEVTRVAPTGRGAPGFPSAVARSHRAPA